MSFQRQQWDDDPPPGNEPESAPPSDHMLLWLIARMPQQKRGTVLSVEHEDVIGRGQDSQIQWEDERMSRRHARFTLESDPETPENPAPVYFIWPLEARNGLFVNGKQIRGAQRLRENDEIQMGDSIFVVKVLES